MDPVSCHTKWKVGKNPQIHKKIKYSRRAEEGKENEESPQSGKKQKRSENHKKSRENLGKSGCFQK